MFICKQWVTSLYLTILRKKWVVSGWMGSQNEWRQQHLSIFSTKGFLGRNQAEIHLPHGSENEAFDLGWVLISHRLQTIKILVKALGWYSQAQSTMAINWDLLLSSCPWVTHWIEETPGKLPLQAAQVKLLNEE